MILVNFIDGFKEYFEKKRDDLHKKLEEQNKKNANLKQEMQINEFKQKVMEMNGYIGKIEEKTKALEDDLKFKKKHIRKTEMMIHILAYSYMKAKGRNDSIQHFINHGGQCKLLDQETMEFISKLNDDLGEYDIFQYRPTAKEFTELRLRKQEAF